MKTIVTYLLILSLVSIPFHAPAPEPPPPKDGELIALACAVIIIGAVVIYGLLKMCKKIPGPPPADPPNPPPPPRPPGTNTNSHPHIGKSSWVMPRIKMPDRDIRPIADWQMSAGAFQSSSDLKTWTNRVFYTNWLCDTGFVSVLADANGPIATNWIYLPDAWTNNQEIICDFGNVPALIPNEDRKHFRMVELQ